MTSPPPTSSPQTHGTAQERPQSAPSSRGSDFRRSRGTGSEGPAAGLSRRSSGECRGLHALAALLQLPQSPSPPGPRPHALSTEHRPADARGRTRGSCPPCRPGPPASSAPEPLPPACPRPRPPHLPRAPLTPFRRASCWHDITRQLPPIQNQALHPWGPRLMMLPTCAWT
jgi:hypothetical protein